MFYICDKKTGKILSLGDELETLEQAQEELKQYYDENDCEIKEYNYLLNHCRIERKKRDSNNKLYVPCCGDSLEDTDFKEIKYFKDKKELIEYLTEHKQELLPDVYVQGGTIGSLVYIEEYFVDFLNAGGTDSIYDWSFDEEEYKIIDIVSRIDIIANNML